MSLTENGLCVPGIVRGRVTEHLTAAPGTDKAPGMPDVHVDGFCARNSGRPDLYPHAPMHFRGPQQPATGRLDEVTAPEPEPEAPARIQLPRSLPPLGPATAAVTVAE